MNSTAYVSAIMAVFNGGRFVREAIDSLLTQTFCDLELIVVDDGSVDGTIDLLYEISDSRLRILKNDRNMGQVASLNRALEAAKGKYIGILDADDIATSTRFAKQTSLLDSHPEIGLVGSFATIIDEAGAETGVWNYSPTEDIAIRWEALSHNPIIHSSIMARRSLVNRIGGYRVDDVFQREFATDYDLISRLLSITRASVIPECLVKYRINLFGLSNTNREAQVAISSRIAKKNVATLVGRDVPDELWNAMKRFDLNWADLKAEEVKEVARNRLAIIDAFEAQFGAKNAQCPSRAQYIFMLIRRLIAQVRRNSTLNMRCRIALMQSAIGLLFVLVCSHLAVHCLRRPRGMHRHSF